MLVVARQPDRDARLEISIVNAVYNQRLELGISQKRHGSALDSISRIRRVLCQSWLESGL
jgi:hypothetical protein